MNKPPFAVGHKGLLVFSKRSVVFFYPKFRFVGLLVANFSLFPSHPAQLSGYNPIRVVFRGYSCITKLQTIPMPRQVISFCSNFLSLLLYKFS